MPEAYALSLLGPGYVLDRYEVQSHVAEGGMGAVWLARMRGQLGFEKRVAIKTILPEYAGDERFRSMFLDEARILSRIDHANVAHIVDLGQHRGILYLVMEWVDGFSLERLGRAFENNRLPMGVALRIVADACMGLHAVHELCDEVGKPLNVVHRDVSPQNILVSDGGIAKLVDFGIVKARDRIAGDTRDARIKGKPGYMPPEQALADAVDHRADLWAMGAVLFRALSGVKPFSTYEDFAAFCAGTVEAPPLADLNAPPVVARLVARALQRAPRNRFQSAAEMHGAIERAMTEASLTTTTVDVAGWVRRLHPTHGTAALGSAAAVVTTLGGAGPVTQITSPGDRVSAIRAIQEATTIFDDRGPPPITPATGETPAVAANTAPPEGDRLMTTIGSSASQKRRRRSGRVAVACGAAVFAVCSAGLLAIQLQTHRHPQQTEATPATTAVFAQPAAAPSEVPAIPTPETETPVMAAAAPEESASSPAPAQVPSAPPPKARPTPSAPSPAAPAGSKRTPGITHSRHG